MFGNSGANHAANLPAMDNKDVQKLFNQRVSEYIIKQYYYTLPLHLFFTIESNVDLCEQINYLCQVDEGAPDMEDSAIDGKLNRHTMSPPKIVSFSGFCVGGFETKLATDQLQCIKGNSILFDWYNNELARAIEKGRNAILVRFYRMLVANAHPENSGNNAGLQTHDQIVGSIREPVLFDKQNADLWFSSMLAVVKQMPSPSMPDDTYGVSTENAFMFGHPSMEQVLMQVEAYSSYDRVGDCASCALFSDVFNKKPRGIMPITSFCVESYTTKSASGEITIFPVLFGRRNMGAAGQLRVTSHLYTTEDGESQINRIKFYSHGHVYDSRCLGLGHIVIKTDQPQTIEGYTGE